MTKKSPELEHLRDQIFSADSAILSALSKRMRIVEKIGAHKRVHNIKPLDAKLRDKRKLSWIKRGGSLNLSKKFVSKIFTLVHDYSVSIEKKSR